jgi:UDP-N-acetylmuramate--alanine ligase
MSDFNRNIAALLREKPRVHFIGIGGAGMLALAGLVAESGFPVSGSDLTENANTARLRARGAVITLGHSAENVRGAGIAVFTSALKPDNPELLAAIGAGLCVMERHKFLGVLFNCYENSCAVSGCHGKSTASGFLVSALMKAGLDPQAVIGANLPLLGGNFRSGKLACVAEACEYKRNFLALRPKVGMILNVGDDHMDYYKNSGDVVSAYDSFLAGIRPGGAAVLNFDDPGCAALRYGGTKYFFGLGEGADCRAADVQSRGGRYAFTILYKGERRPVRLSVYGKHNIYNALAAYLAARLMGAGGKKAAGGIAAFAGAERRFEYKGKFNGADIVSDYAHHPRELSALFAAAREVFGENTAAVFQPHTYSRTKTLMREFEACFDDAGKLVILPAYAAREEFDAAGSAKTLYERVRLRRPDTHYAETYAGAEALLREKRFAAVLVAGAGDVDGFAERLSLSDKNSHGEFLSGV